MTQRMKEPAPIDKGWAWMIVLGAFIQIFCLLGTFKSLGLIIIELMTKFDISITEAVIPATVIFITFALISPLAVLMGELFSPRKVVIFGSIFSFICISLSSLLYNVIFFTIFFGVGIGFGGACFYGNGILLLGKYFHRHRSLANGIAMAGSSVGQFALPPLLEFLMENYGLGGATLIMGAMFLHGCIAGALFRSGDTYDFTPQAPRTPETKGQIIYTKGDDAELDENDLESHDLIGKDNSPKDTSPEIFTAIKIKNGNTELSQRVGKGSSSDLAETETNLTSNLSASLIAGIDIVQHDIDLDEKTTSMSLDTEHDKTQIVSNVTDPAVPERKRFWQKVRHTFNFKVLRSYVTLFYTTVAILTYLGFMNITLFFPAIFMERGIKKRHTATLLSIVGVGDLIARIGMSFFADRNYIARYKLMGISCCLCAANIFMMYFANTFAWAAVHSCLYGFTGGTYIFLVAVVLVDLVGLADFSQNLVVVMFIQGIGSAAGQPILGSLRDYTKSCDVVVLLCAFSLMAGGLLLFAYPLVRKLEDKRLIRKRESNA